LAFLSPFYNAHPHIYFYLIHTAKDGFLVLYQQAASDVIKTLYFDGKLADEHGRYTHGRYEGCTSKKVQTG